MLFNESNIRRKLNTLLSEKLNERKRELAEAIMCNCIADKGVDCGCEDTQTIAVAEGTDEYVKVHDPHGHGGVPHLHGMIGRKDRGSKPGTQNHLVHFPGRNSTRIPAKNLHAATKPLDENSTASLGTTSLSGMDSTDGILFGKNTVDAKPKKKLQKLKKKN